MFELNELVVYPSQGVGRVERIESQEIGGACAELYIVRILSNNVTLMVPVANAENVGLRSVCSFSEGQAILTSLDDRSEFTGYTGQNWNRRYREYSEKLKSGYLGDVAYVLKELFLIGKDKELSFGERRLLEQAMGLVSMELAFALNRDQDDIRDDIMQMFDDVINVKEKEEKDT